MVEELNPRDTGYELGDMLGGTSCDCVLYPIASRTFSIRKLSNLCCLRLCRDKGVDDGSAGENVKLADDMLLKIVPFVFLAK